jgi:hypothetical protein
MNVETQLAVQTALVPIIVGIVEALKTAGLPSKYAPVVSLMLGVLATVSVFGNSIVWEVMNGLLVGLSASGLYSGIKKVGDSL